ncbi:hypothetical protein PV05_02371 [Exophiala xenobiotica]|uniref:Uncharacterized protein n=1 Tax=Exophiala xenobiotica TaxID=348802 RepID=A0A0D2EQ80_9EURO|nr:uncharacterized protein PV05_02371 [Exophiala xenobiotica]KIW57813.1 hypothetical protein PV05_02371 [Exophiala xenobiotica]
MADQRKDKRISIYRVANLCVVLILSSSILCIARLLLVKGAVSSTIAPGIYISVGLSIPTIIAASIRCYLIFRRRQHLQTISPSPALPRLDSACATIVQCLILLWMLLAGCVLLPVAFRAPICLSEPLQQWKNDLAGNNWRYGLSCSLHRTIVALSILTALSMCVVSFFDRFDRQQNHRGSTFLCGYRQGSPKESRYKDRAGASLSSSRSAYEFDKDDRLFLVPERRPSRFEREQWLQRRNSLSSQRAIYPHKYHYYDPRSRYIAHSHAHSSRYSSTLRSVSEGACLDLSDRSSSLTSSQSSGSLARLSRPSTMASARYRSSSNPEKPGPTHNGSSTPTVPSISPLPAVPPPTWCPSLQHTPLSADPFIRALSTGAVLPPSRSTQTLLAPSPPRGSKDSVAQKTVSACPKVSAFRKEQMPASGTPPVQPMPTMPPPPPPSTMQSASQPPTTAVASPSASLGPAPPIPTRSPGHHLFPSTRSTSTGTRSSLRRPSPIRYRQHPSTYQYQYQRARARNANPSVSMYSASSYGTDRSVGGAGAGAGTAKVGGRK